MSDEARYRRYGAPALHKWTFSVDFDQMGNRRKISLFCYLSEKRRFWQ